MRAFAKHLIETLLTASVIQRLALRRLRRRTLVLAYHNVMPEGERALGDRSLHLPQCAFAAQLDALLATHEIIPLDAVLEAPKDVRPRVALTFDDAYRGALTAGIAEVAKRGLPATVFVAPGLFGSSTWWDRLSDTVEGSLAPALRSAALWAHGGRPERVVPALGDGCTSLPPWAQIATEAEVLRAATTVGITLGAHGWSHANLAALGPEDLAAELDRPLAWLQASGARTVPWLAYPYGLTSEAVGRATADAGYLGAFRVDGGWMPDEASVAEARYDLPRLNVPAGLSLAGFRLRVAGL